MKTTNINALAEQLDAYIRFRAQKVRCGICLVA
jgi:hypothetical protein